MNLFTSPSIFLFLDLFLCSFLIFAMFLGEDLNVRIVIHGDPLIIETSYKKDWNIVIFLQIGGTFHND
jgi:hypothetical protein